MADGKEVENMRKLLFWVVGIVVVVGLSVGGSAFTILAGQIKEKVSADILLRYEESAENYDRVNQRDHKDLKEGQIRFEDEVYKRFDKFDGKLDKSMSEIKEMIRER